MAKYVSDEFGTAGIAFTSLLMLVAFKRVFKGFTESELMAMIKTRHKRTAGWMGGLLTVAAVVFLVPVKHYATGDFEVRPGDRQEVHAPVTGFIRSIEVAEGDRVTAGDLIARLASPDLAAQISTKEAELREVAANLRKLRLGSRPEQIAAQRDRVGRLRSWVNLGKQELERSSQAHNQELRALDQRIERTKTQLAFGKQNYEQSEKLYRLQALAGAQLRQEEVNLSLQASQVEEAEAERSVKVAHGLRIPEAEVARREQELADVVGQLELLEAGTRPEEIAAEVARQEQLTEQLDHLTAQLGKLEVRATFSGVVATPRLHEKIGQLVPQGTAILALENAATSRVEIAVSEDDVLGVKSSQPVTLKARALPYDTFEAQVERIAPATIVQLDKHRTVLVVHCSLANQDGRLKSGMTGFGRIFRGYRTLGGVMLGKGMRYVRTEFWW